VGTIDTKPSAFTFLYPDEMPLVDKVRTIARDIYGASDIAIDSDAAAKFKKITSDGYGHFPVCMAKTQYSFSADPTALGAPSGHVLPIKDVRLSAGAEFVVVLTGAIMQMPGLPKNPSSEKVGVAENGSIYGLF
jgi:formate--tetrahydrofolate ligase